MLSPLAQTGLAVQNVIVTNVQFFVDILVSLEGIFSLTAEQQAILIGVRPPLAARRRTSR